MSRNEGSSGIGLLRNRSILSTPSRTHLAEVLGTDARILTRGPQLFRPFESQLLLEREIATRPGVHMGSRSCRYL
jgi:hypothetical protein